MLNRRYLRIKVLQALYSFLQDDKKDINAKERELKLSIDKIYELYIYLLLLLRELRMTADRMLEERKRRLLPSAEDINPNTRFVDDPILLKIYSSAILAKQKNQRSIVWASDEDFLIKGLLSEIIASPEYIAYINESPLPQDGDKEVFERSKEFISSIYKKYISENKPLKQHLSEKNMHWTEDCHLAHICVVKTIKSLKPDGDIELMPLFKEEDDNEFMLTLFRQTILDDEKISAFIKPRISNWEPERIAAIDMILMKMAITEILFFPGIPVKASLNEYIEISKTYSSPKSNTFINGILDAVVKDLKTQNKLTKTGRGLIG